MHATCTYYNKHRLTKLNVCLSTQLDRHTLIVSEYSVKHFKLSLSDWVPTKDTA